MGKDFTLATAEFPKIAIVGPSAPPLGAGGVASSHFHLYRCFRKRGLDAVLLTFNEREGGGTDSGILRFGTKARERDLLAIATAVYLKARGSVKLAYQLVDIVMSVPGVMRMNRALKELDPDHIIIPDHCGPGLFLRKGRARLTMVAHHNPARFRDTPLIGDFCPKDVEQALALEQRVLHKVDAVIAPSRYMEEVFRDTFSFDGPVATIHNPLDLALIDEVVPSDPRRALGLPPHAPFIYIPSAGSRLKGERFVARIIGRLASSYRGDLGFYLSGRISAELAQEIDALPGNVRVLAPGHLDYQDNLALVKSCSFGISPTLIENFGMAILEAGFCGVPMVVFRVGGNPEIISDGENGFCVPCPDWEGLVAAAERLLDPRYRDRMRRVARSYAREQFDTEAIVDRYLTFCGISV